MFCQKCGAEIDNEAVICVKCGEGLNKDIGLDKKNGLGIAGLVLGILSIVIGWLIGIIGIAMGIVGIACSVKQRKLFPNSIANAGLITSIIGTATTTIILIAGLLVSFLI